MHRHRESLYSLSRGQFELHLFKCYLHCPPLAYYSSEITYDILAAIANLSTA